MENAMSTINRRDLLAYMGISSLGLLLNGCGGNKKDVVSEIEFERLGVLPGKTASGASGVSNDGRVVVGTSDGTAFRWTAETGMVRLGDINNYLVAVSGDGNVIVGTANDQAFRWTQETGMVSLGKLPGASGSGAVSISGDGTVVVGTSGAGAFRWTQETGMVGLGRLPSSNTHAATAISKDGNVIVGTSAVGAFRWTAETGMVALDSGASSIYTTPAALSRDGKIIVGHINTISHFDAFRWTQATGMKGLQELPNSNGTQILAMSGSGDVILGQSNSLLTIQTTTMGIRSLKNILIANNIHLKGVYLSTFIIAISDDGKTIVGQLYGGSTSEAFRLYHPKGFSTL
jgi:uncharacterized membrane protein